jgi:hypothetical protein
MQMLGGKLSYHRDATRGACFTATIPRKIENSQVSSSDRKTLDRSSWLRVRSR